MRMKIKQMNLYLSLGLLINAIILSANHFIVLPDFIYGLGLGIGISLELIGIYSINHDINKIKNFKKNLIKKFLKRA